MADEKKFLDQEGVKHLWSKINMQDYPNNETLMAVINAIDETKADKSELVQSDWNQHNETAVDYIKNRTHWVEDGVIEILPETTVELDPEKGLAFLPELGLVAGMEYTVIYNGTEYVGKCVAIDDHLALGNYGALMDPPANTGEPFVIVHAEVGHEDGVDIYKWVIISLDGSTSVTLSIEGNGEIVHKLDNKYLDLAWIPEHEEIQLAAEKTVTSGIGQPTETTYGFPDLTRFDVYNGQTLIVYWDGKRYETKVVKEGEKEETLAVAGNLSYIDASYPDTGEPFMLTFVNSRTNVYNGAFNDGESAVASVYTYSAKSTLPEEFLPESVEKTTNRVTEINEASDDEHYPTAKAVLDYTSTEYMELINFLVEQNLLIAIEEDDGGILTDENENILIM